MDYVTDITKLVDSQRQIDAPTDFSSAIDKVDHRILLSKLQSYGVHGDLLRWLTSYLYDRLLSVAVHGFKSDDYIARSGVPQGSHLEPILFLIFINDISDSVKHCRYSIFADDLKLYLCVKSQSDVTLLQNDIAAVNEWCVSNKMILNPRKCVHTKFTRKNNPINSSHSISGEPLTESTSTRDLGVLLDQKFNFIEHIDNIVTLSWKMLGFVKRTCNLFKNTKTFITIFNALVRSKLEYASNVWNPIYEVLKELNAFKEILPAILRTKVVIVLVVYVTLPVFLLQNDFFGASP